MSSDRPPVRKRDTGAGTGKRRGGKPAPADDAPGFALSGRTLETAGPGAHCAFLFDHAAFKSQLERLLLACLAEDDPAPLAEWCFINQARLTNPFTGELLVDGWEETLDAYDVAEFGLYAMTAFFEPTSLRGLDSHADDVRQAMAAHGSSADAIDGLLAGAPISNGDLVYRVPGGRIAGLISPAEVAATTDALKKVRAGHRNGNGAGLTDSVDDMLALLEEAAVVKVGLMLITADADADPETSGTLHAATQD